MKVFATCFFGILALLIIALLVLPYYTSYSLDPVNLTIKVGPFRKKIPIAEITEAFPTRNPLFIDPVSQVIYYLNEAFC